MGKKSKSRRGSASSRPNASPPRPSRSPPQKRSKATKLSSPSSPTPRDPITPSPCPRRHPPSPSSSPSQRGSPATPSSPSPRGTPPTPSSSPRWGTPAPSPPYSPPRDAPASSPRRGPAPTPRRGTPATSPSSSPRRGAPAPSPSSSPRRSTPATSPSSAPRRGTPGPSPSSPRRGTPAPSPLSSPCRGTQAPSPSSSTQRGPAPTPPVNEATPVFDIFLDDAQNSVGKAFGGIRELFTSILKNDKLEGKLVTKAWGNFMIRIFSSANSMEDPICGLYRTHDIYLDSVLSQKMWYRFKDHQAVLPQEIESEGSVSFDFKSTYEDLGCNPDVANQIKVGNSIAREFYNTLQQLEIKHKSLEVKKALVMFVLFAEALRFPAFESWLLTHIAQEESVYIPTKYSLLFRKWGKLSSAFHDGKDKFRFAHQKVKKHCKTYDDLCLLLGIVNRENWRKKTKATKNRKKKNKQDTEEAEASSDNKRTKRRKKKSPSM